MKKLNKIQINPEKVITNEELISLRGGYGSYVCWKIGPPCQFLLTYINTASCLMAREICFYGFGGGCVTGGDC
jgi:hypothetical protein